MPDTRNSKVGDIIAELRSFDLDARFTILWPIRGKSNGIRCGADRDGMLRPADAVILAVAHESYVRVGWPLVIRLLKGGSGGVLTSNFDLSGASGQTASISGV